MSSEIIPDQLKSPYIPLRISLKDGLAILHSLGCEVVEENESERCFRAHTSTGKVAVYPKDDEVGSVWYDDATGRSSDDGKEKKVQLYLERYGSLLNWELRMDNGLMRYWFNPKDKVNMVYGIQNDVIRFNQYDQGI